MGGDHGPSITIPSIIHVLRESPDLKVTLFGKKEAFGRDMSIWADSSDRLEFVSCETEVTMDEKPSNALRHGQSSSLYRSIQMVARQEADACISAGNTGAFMAIGHYLLKTFPGINRPAACTAMPTMSGSCLMLDLGANMDCKPEDLLQFGQMGSVMASVIRGIKKPRVALLNVGEEAGKGNEQVKSAAAMFEQCTTIHYTGFVEGNDIFEGRADVVVCDGFAGNVVLKASEGVAKLIASRIQQAYTRSFYTKALATLSKPLLTDLANELDPSRYNGATLLGLQGTAVVSHGKTTVEGFTRALYLAVEQARQNLPQQIQSRLVVSS